MSELTSTMQGTLKEAIFFEGKGLHTGRKSQVTIHPAGDNTGIVFRRIDKKGKNTEILASWKNTKKLPLCTCIATADGHIHVRTIEHLMAAFYACGIDNVLIEVKGTELPILDGSAKCFIEKIDSVGVRAQNSARKIFCVNKAFEVRDGKAFLRIEPAEELKISVKISLQKIGGQHWEGELTPAIFSEEISSARTFGRLKNGLLAQLTRFSKDPICLGANTSSAIVVIKGDQVLNKGGLRMSDEYVRHRLLDLVGDLMLSGGHIQGRITALSPAHRMTHELLRQMFSEGAFSLK